MGWLRLACACEPAGVGRGKETPLVSPSKAHSPWLIRSTAPTHTVNRAGYETSRQRGCPYFSDNRNNTQWKALVQLSK